MKTESYSLEQVDVMIDYLDKQIEAGKDTPAMLNALQQRLDIIDMTYQDDPRFAKFYPHMLELQALLYGRRNQDDRALQFMKEAVRQAGGVKRLRSSTIREYITTRSKPVTAHHQRRRRKGLFIGFKSRNAKIAFATTLGVLMMSVATVHFVPQVAAFSTLLTNHSQISSAKNTYDSLTREYTQCSSELMQERNSVNPSDQTAVDAYNNATRQCQTIQQAQNRAASKYDSLIGAH